MQINAFPWLALREAVLPPYPLHESHVAKVHRLLVTI